MTRRLHLVVPGALDQRTGGYVYDARMVDGLRDRGWDVEAHELAGSFPGPDDVSRAAMAAALHSIPDGELVVLDGLAMGGQPEALAEHQERLRLISLVHHPLADESGLAPHERARFVSSERGALATCRGAIVTSPFVARRVAEYGVSPERIRVAPPGTASASAARGPDVGQPPLLLSVGTVTPRKGHDVLVDALARVKDLPWRCAIAGSSERAPEHVRRVRERIDAADLSGRVELLGEVDDPTLHGLYDGASAFVLASRYEGYGMVLTEALARGLPVVATTGGAVPDTVPESAALLVAPDDPPALAGALRTLLSQPERRARMATAAREHAANLADWSRAAAVFESALLSLAESPAAVVDE